MTRLLVLAVAVVLIPPDATTASWGPLQSPSGAAATAPAPLTLDLGARQEVWAVGFRNPHRLHCAIDEADPRNNRLIANSIGMRTWETINIVHRGANYGYSLREGNEAMKFDNLTEPRPEIDRIPAGTGDGIRPGALRRASCR